ncbi:hypothetical protein PUN28_006752 [Cardiocondyla obscurior]|uniref:Uncharacterized protein n=1 Tax=Cardiocondyla obscurior TaxID=286306 RepID=A0AAW2G2P8_9HYME
MKYFVFLSINNRRSQVGQNIASSIRVIKIEIFSREAMKKDTRRATVSGSSSTQVLTTYMRVACTDTHVMWARLPEIP